VRTLQKLLNANGYTVALSGPGSAGNETLYFGPATRAAVIKFQIAKGIVPAVGYVGVLTRAALAFLLL
jgi:peptidoglycan hydrolase-like protein with peptidoglycan-binding domain